MAWRLAIVAAVLAAVIGAYVWGRGDGRALAEAAHAAKMQRAQADALRAADLASRKEADRLAAEAARNDLAQQLEDMANADPAGGECLPVSRVLRLNQR